MKFHEKSGTYQDTNLDAELLYLARQVAVLIGHGKDPSETRQNLCDFGFEIFGSGSGGHTVYRLRRSGAFVLLYITPYGPSILDEMPRYILLEKRKKFYKSRLYDKSDGTILDAATPRAARVVGYTYSGAFFQAQEWAALTLRYKRELVDYSEACRIMGTRRLSPKKRNPQEIQSAVPPLDLPSLKAFIRMGRLTWKQRRDNHRFKMIQAEVKKMAKIIKQYQAEQKAPRRVILYLEGLDCAGKSSTGMLICQALEQCGYDVKVAQHNRPPTTEQKKYPWMHRIRFEYPDDLYDEGDDVPDYSSVVWDRGPAGDFVYGGFQELSISDKLEKYEAFREYDANCRKEHVLFCKILFVSDKDSIASTLGKRLAHKKIAQDLRVWLDANSVQRIHEGLEQIETHIDPTDFIAFNKYEDNLAKFAEFARNTDCKYGNIQTVRITHTS